MIDINSTTTTTTNIITTFSHDKLNSLATWFRTNVVYAFFTPLERCSCINPSPCNDDDVDDDNEETHNHLLMCSKFSSSVKSTDFAVNNDNDVVILLVHDDDGGVKLHGIFKGPKAIRGGIPVCFPQFGSCGSLEQHGFARNKMWTIDESPPPLKLSESYGNSFIDLLLKPSEEDLKCWPHSFELRLKVALAADGDLALIPRVRNVNGKPFGFTFAFHTYLSVSDISEVRVEGLETLDYLDNLSQRERFTEQGDALTFESEVDRVYLHSPNIIAVIDHEKKRTYVVRKDGLPDAAVWNPWEKKSKAMADFGDEEYKQMLCVDGAAVERAVSLKPGEEWTGRLDIMVVASSFCSELCDFETKGL
ncbi:hypothetical protein ACFE04_026486 [Oxalis oulophora]